jgi:hypothetical protein
VLYPAGQCWVLRNNSFKSDRAIRLLHNVTEVRELVRSQLPHILGDGGLPIDSAFAALDRRGIDIFTASVTVPPHATSSCTSPSLSAAVSNPLTKNKNKTVRCSLL